MVNYLIKIYAKANNIFMRFWRFLKENSEPVKIISSFAVALFVLAEYLDASGARRTNRSLEYVKLYHATDLRQARFSHDPFISYLDLNRSLELMKPRQQEATFDVDKNTSEIVHSNNNNESPKIETHEDEFQDLYTLKSFYNPVAYCAYSGLCDPVVICTNFFGDMQQFSELFMDIANKKKPEKAQADYTGWAKSQLYFVDQFIAFCEEDGRRLSVNEGFSSKILALFR